MSALRYGNGRPVIIVGNIMKMFPNLLIMGINGVIRRRLWVSVFVIERGVRKKAGKDTINAPAMWHDIRTVMRSVRGIVRRGQCHVIGNRLLASPTWDLMRNDRYCADKQPLGWYQMFISPVDAYKHSFTQKSVDAGHIQGHTQSRRLSFELSNFFWCHVASIAQTVEVVG